MGESGMIFSLELLKESIKESMDEIQEQLDTLDQLVEYSKLLGPVFDPTKHTVIASWRGGKDTFTLDLIVKYEGKTLDKKQFSQEEVSDVIIPNWIKCFDKQFPV